MKRYSFIIIVLLTAVPLFSEPDLAEALNNLRVQRGLAILKQDRVLRQVASDYAEELLERKILSHQGRGGERALSRYRSCGGTSVIVGEIIGSGVDLNQVIRAWQQSPTHLGAIIKEDWTHLGWGTVRGSVNRIWVVLFTVKRVENLKLEKKNGVFMLSGFLITEEAEQPVLFSGINPLSPLKWEPETGYFSFSIPLKSGMDYHRLGYSSRDSQIKITDVFYPERLLTFFPERERQ